MRISKLVRSQRVEGRILVYLENGDLLRLSENEVVAFGLYAGADLSEERLEELRQAAKTAAVKGKALDLAAARPMSKKELMDKLTARPRGRGREPLATAEQAAMAVERLEELGYLNDREYAKTLVRHYAAKGYGTYKIKDELYRRGVPREDWEEALAQLEESGDSAMEAFIEKKLRDNPNPGPKELKRLSDALIRRGFSWSEVRDALRPYGGRDEE